MAGGRSPAGLQERIIPLVLRACEFPDDADFIKALTYVNFKDGADRDLAWRQLLTALGKPPEPEQPKEPKRDDWFLSHPYPMPPHFTGRAAERTLLTRWLNEDPAHPVLVMRALGGFGKSALTWHWLMHDVSPTTWPRVVWWSFYENEASFEVFLRETLGYLSGGKIDATKISGKDAVKELLRLLHPPGTLLVLDGFERELRAFCGLNAAYQGDEARADAADRDCISPLAELFLHHIALQPNLHSKVLLTTRLCPRLFERHGALLHGCREEELTRLQPADAVEFFRAQGIRGTHTEIEAACAPYGYHPLSLRLLAGLITGDFQQPGDIAAARRLDVSGDLIQRQHHVLETSYERLSVARRVLLGCIACLRSLVGYDVLKALAAERVGTLDADLRDLVARGLLHHDRKANRFDLHPIVRRYAYDRLTARDRAAAHTRLRDYFAAVPKMEKVTRLEDLAPVIELYHHTVRAGQLDDALAIYRDRLARPLYYQLGAYPLIVELLRALFPDGEERPPRLEEADDQAWTLSSLANAYNGSGQPRRAGPLFEQQIAVRERLRDQTNVAVGLGNVAVAQIAIGALRTAEVNLRRSIVLSRENEMEWVEAVEHLQLGRLLAYRGMYTESEEELASALTLFERDRHVQLQGMTWAHGALRELLRLRVESTMANYPLVIGAARRALELADETARTRHPFERDYVRAYWLLGAAHRVVGDFEVAERHLHEALERCRRINLVELEAHILTELARLRAATGGTDEAGRLAEEARVIAERCGYVLQGADAHLELAKLALTRGDKAGAKEHAQKARTLATCDGPPDYTY